MSEYQNPVCGECGNMYDPQKIQVERTLFPPEGAIRQWKCDSCGNWVNTSPAPQSEEAEG